MTLDHLREIALIQTSQAQRTNAATKDRPLPFNRVVRCHECEDFNIAYTYAQDDKLLNSPCSCCGSRDKSSMPIDMFRHRYGYAA